MKGYVTNIEKETLENENYRKVLYTANYSQLVIMSLKPGEEIGEEIHGLDQFIRVEQGQGQAILDGKKHDVKGNYAVVVPAGTRHNFINTSKSQDLKLYTLYSPPEHQYDTVQPTKADEHSEHFDGRTSE